MELLTFLPSIPSLCYFHCETDVIWFVVDMDTTEVDSGDDSRTDSPVGYSPSSIMSDTLPFTMKDLDNSNESYTHQSTKVNMYKSIYIYC